MSTYVSNTVGLSAPRSAQVAKQLRIGLENSALVRAARADLRVTPADLAAVQDVVSAWSPPLMAALATLSPTEHANAHRAIAHASSIGRQQVAASRAEIAAQVTEAKQQLAQALAHTQRRIDNAIAESTAQAVVASGQQLGYRVTRRRDGDTTAIDMRRDHEIVLAVVQGDTILVDHAGLADGTCLQRQGALLEEIRNRGVELAESHRDNHFDATGGRLIRAAVGDRPSRLADPGSFALSAAQQAEHTQQAPLRDHEIAGPIDDSGITA